MGDTSHLEKMGRELNCPICLSLLNSSVSLTCNHVFCNSCIMKSMKSGSNCPVCKVPYRPREVRPVPHMDNLVSIYKSMEAASGINIFVTQNTPSTKLSDKQQTEDDQNCGGQKADNASGERAKNKRKLKGKGPKGLFKTNPKDSGPSPAKPSFPGKKRVQVPPYPLSETPKRPAKLDRGLSETVKGGPKSNSIVLNEKPAVNDNGELVFSPFFWLREDDDVEYSSQQMDGDLALSSSLPNAPSFSDIKGSDDEMPSELTPKGKVDTEFNVADTFDSEIFEWTQRACSPELCSSPMKMLVPDSEEFDGAQKEECKPDSVDASRGKEAPRTENMDCKEGTDCAATRLPTMSYLETKNANVQNGIGKSKKRGRKPNKKVQNKRAKRGASEILGIHISSQIVAEDFMIEQGCGKDGSFSNLRKETNEGCEKAYFDNSGPDAAPENVSVLSIEAKSLNQGDENVVTALPASLDKKCDSGGSLNLKKRGRRCDNVKTESQKGRTVRSKSRKLESAENNMLEEGAITPNQINYDVLSNSPCVSFPLDDDGTVSGLGEKASKPCVNQKCDKKLRPSKNLKVSMDNISKYGLINDTQEHHTKVSTQSTQPVNNNKCTPEVGVLNSSTARKVLSITSGGALRKCESVPTKISCAFCHSAEESEASGEIVHYFNGRPVAADYNGGSSVIHSHRNCAEWAPNVYFEDGTAVNLQAELARSRRITCCCCGIKGAALGCYAKSCRKSFHVLCAKLTPQCRWDTDNFVMLCPLHASSKLPNEISESPPKARKKCSPKGQSYMQQTQVAVKHDVSAIQRWNSSGSPGKLVLCCSALTVAEKEIVSEFERLSGVTVLKKWGPGITHVIASSDENGACRRTLKFLMGILEGKWILSIEWIKACMKANEHVAEEQYEIGIDIHGIGDGPRLGRLRLLNKQPKLFNGFKFYFFGDFMPLYKGYLQDLVIAAGGTVLHRKPIVGNQETLLLGYSQCETFIIYSLEQPDNCGPDGKNHIFTCRRSEAEALARLTGAKVASNSWFLNSIAACQVQNVAE